MGLKSISSGVCKKMKLRCTLALMVMLAMTAGRIREKQGINMRSLVKAA